MIYIAGVYALAALNIEMWGKPDPASNTNTLPGQCSIVNWLHPEDGFTVMNLTDGTDTRCMSVIAPVDAPKPMPVLFWYHGSGGNAGGCGRQSDSREQPIHESLAMQAINHGFALVCGEATQYESTPGGAGGGQWDIPEVQTDATGTPCDAKDSKDINYMDAVIKALDAHGGFDTKSLYTGGCSMGSAFSGYISGCLQKNHGADILPAFATHSTGLKIKGDGNNMPRATFDPQYGWGECPDCQYFPFVPSKADLKACIFDDYQDPTPMDPFFYRTSVQLRKKWDALGNKYNNSYAQGGHCAIQSYADIVQCLDDGTGRLIKKQGVPARYAHLVEEN